VDEDVAQPRKTRAKAKNLIEESSEEESSDEDQVKRPSAKSVKTPAGKKPPPPRKPPASKSKGSSSRPPRHPPAQSRKRQKSESDAEAAKKKVTLEALRKKSQFRESFQTVSKPFSKWKLACSSLQEWKELANTFKDSKVRCEKKLYQVLVHDFLPDLPEMISEAVSLFLPFNQINFVTMSAGCAK
jgi:hypothetical protein